MRCPSCNEETNPTLVYCMVCGAPLEVDFATIKQAEEERARETRMIEALKEARQLLWLSLFVLGCSIALRKVLIGDYRYDHVPAYRVPVALVKEAMEEPQEALPVDRLEIALPKGE